MYIYKYIYIYIYNIYIWGSMECGSSISNDGYGQDRYRIMAILAQDANTDRKDTSPPFERAMGLQELV